MSNTATVNPTENLGLDQLRTTDLGEAKPVHTILERAVKLYADRPALDFEGLCFTYAELSKLVDKIACGLQAEGVKRGTKIGLFLPNTHYSIACYFAGVESVPHFARCFKNVYDNPVLKHRKFEENGQQIRISFERSPLLMALAPEIKKLAEKDLGNVETPDWKKSVRKKQRQWLHSLR